jgi:hypothetical protein
MRASPDVIFRALDDGGVLVHLNGNQIFELNATAAHIWPLVADGASETAIVSSLVETFDIDAPTAARELDALLTDLSAAGLIDR